MPRLNDRFMEALTDPEGQFKIAPRGYALLKREQDGTTVDIGFNPWMEPYIKVSGSLALGILKGGINSYDGKTFGKGGLHSEGIHMGINDSYGDRRYLITDTDGEKVMVSFWDPNANTPDSDGILGGQYGDYSPVPESDAGVVKMLVSGVIDAAKVAVDSQLTPN